MTIMIPQKKITVFYIIIIVSVVLITVLSFIFILTASSGTTEAHIMTQDKSFEVSLEKDDEFDLKSNGYTYRIKVDNGEISVIQADCPDGVCRNTPAIGKKKGSIVCLPGKLIIECKTAGGESDGADVVVP